MVTDIAIWNASLAPARYGAREATAIQADVPQRRAGYDYTDAVYVPVKTYSKSVRPSVPSQAAAAEIVATVTAGGSIDRGRNQAAVQLYASIFNYRYPAPAALISMRV